MPDASLYHPMTIGSLELPGNLFLAPVAGYTDRAYRALCADEGAAFSFTELVSAESMLRNLEREVESWKGGGKPGPVLRLIRRAEGEKRYAVQLFGAEPERMAMAAEMFAGLDVPDAIDINAGCPMPKITKTGAGCALMRDPPLLGRIVAAVEKVCREKLGGIPVTVKMRTGWDGASIHYRECARIAREAGAAMVSLHGRTRAQMYTGRADWAAIADLAGRLDIPVCGSGDLYTPEDAARMLRETNCAAVMFARGAMGNPFIFSAAREYLQTGAWHLPEPEQRIRAGMRQLELLAADSGEKPACLEMRKHFCAYTKGVKGQKGIAGGAALRDRVVHCETIEEYRQLFIEAGLL